MPDLNILEMLNGDKPAYVDGLAMWAQRLLVIIMASEEKDTGRAYGGELAALVGEAVLPPDTLSLKVSEAIPDALAWLKQNSDAPNELQASVDDVVADGDHLTVFITVSLNGEETTVSMNI